MGKTANKTANKAAAKTAAKKPNHKCVQCGRRKTVQQVGSEGSIFKCTGCGAMFDTSPDEGGSYYTDPTKRIEKEEHPVERRANRRG
jgi:ribosomal protein L37AE/L43A